MALATLTDSRLTATRCVTGHLAEIAGHLETERHAPEVIARFLMRCSFTMFAEGVGLLPDRPFTGALEDVWRPHPETFLQGLEALWRTLRDRPLLRAGGDLFQDPSALPLGLADLRGLLEAARCDWSAVEPAIFGTLLERALGARERHRLGAHFTPRAHVERLVRPTLEEPLRADWENARAEARRLEADGKRDAATKALRAFHEELCRTRVLDPACGTGNFLYVALDVLEQIESEVLSALASAGERGAPLQRVTPGQLFGIEVKPWAKEIAELVLWIGHLQRRGRTRGSGTEPPSRPGWETSPTSSGGTRCWHGTMASREGPSGPARRSSWETHPTSGPATFARRWATRTWTLSARSTRTSPRPPIWSCTGGIAPPKPSPARAPGGLA